MMRKTKYRSLYRSPIGNIVLTSDGEHLTALVFESHCDLSLELKDEGLPVFETTRSWLDTYFKGETPSFLPPILIENDTPFRSLVREEMLKIPYGEIVTYADIAKSVGKKVGKEKMSAQAVGGAVGVNPICIIIPCHRVIGKNGNLTGYGGGMENKIGLLKHEGHDMKKFIIPMKGTKL